MSDTRPQLLNFGELDRIILTLYVALVAIGWLMIYAVNYNAEAPFNFFDFSTTPGKQLFFIVVCFALLFFILLTDWAFWRTFGLVIYLISLVLMAGTLVFGREVNGANAWYQFGGFSLQPAEIAKFGTCLAMAGYLSSAGVNLREWRSRLYAFGLFMLPVLIILLQKDTGSALVFFSFMLVLYREGLSPSWYLLGFGTAALVILGLSFDPPYIVVALLTLGVTTLLITRFKERQRVWWGVFALLLASVLFWTPLQAWVASQLSIPLPTNPDALKETQMWMIVAPALFFLVAFFPNYLKKTNLIQRRLQLMLLLLTLSGALIVLANFACYSLLAPHQQERIKVWLRPKDVDPRGSAYNLLHSKMAIGSGGLFGKGFLEGNMTKLKYVPEQSTDFIFCTVGEEQGFLGVALLVFIFGAMLYRITVIAEKQRSNFSRLYAYCVAGILFVHFIVNVGMTMGLFPIIGIPLPFISYGGSSLIGFTLMIGVLLKLDSFRNQA